MSDKPQSGAAEDSQEKPRIRFDFIKSNYFRVIHVDGIHGGITPHGLIQLAVFSDRLPIPQQTVHELIDHKTLGKELPDERIARDAIIREVEAELLMDLGTAEKLNEWLAHRIADLRKALGTSSP